MIKFAKRFARDEDGATMVEYGLMLGLIAAVCITAITTVGSQSNALFTAIGGKLTTAATTAAK